MKGKITRVRTKVTDKGTLAIINIDQNETPVFLSEKQVKAATGLNTVAPAVLRGAEMSVTFYAVDEELVSGQKCTKENTIVKEFEIELPETTVKIQTAAAFGASMFG